MEILFFLVALLACLIGKICGMGGGVIIKPVLDATGILGVSAINFLSGCTVLGMSLWSVGKSFATGEKSIDLRISTPLGIGAAVGGIAGKILFNTVAEGFGSADRAGGVQAVILFAATMATFIYTLKKNSVNSFHVRHWVPCVLIGVGLGMLGSFLGIGGGPFNMAVLFLFFSMPTKTAAQNSLYIIMISQLASLIKTLLAGSVPAVGTLLLAGMIICGVLGSEIGRRLHRRISEDLNTRLLEGAMILVMIISLYNARVLFAG